MTIIHEFQEEGVPTRVVVDGGYLRIQQEVRGEWRAKVCNRIDATNALEAVSAELLRTRAVIAKLEKERLARLTEAAPARGRA